MTNILNDSEHPCYKCLVRACCHNWCSAFFRWMEEYQDTHGTFNDDILVNFVVKNSRNEAWTKRD